MNKIERSWIHQNTRYYAISDLIHNKLFPILIWVIPGASRLKRCKRSYLSKMLNSLWHRNFEKKWTTEIDTRPQMLTSWIFGPKIPRITGFSEFNDLSNFPILLIFRYPIKFLAETSFFGRKFLFDLKIFTPNFFPTVPIRFRGTSIFCVSFLKCMNHDFWNSRVTSQNIIFRVIRLARCIWESDKLFIFMIYTAQIMTLDGLFIVSSIHSYR